MKLLKDMKTLIQNPTPCGVVFFQKLARWKVFNSESDMLENFNAKIDTLLGFFSKSDYKRKIRQKKLLSKMETTSKPFRYYGRKTIKTRFFSTIFDFKIWFFQKELIGSVAHFKELHTESVVFKYCLSETNTWKNFHLRTWNVEKLSLQYLTCSKSFISKTGFFGNLTSESFILEWN